MSIRKFQHLRTPYDPIPVIWAEIRIVMEQNGLSMADMVCLLGRLPNYKTTGDESLLPVTPRQLAIFLRLLKGNAWVIRHIKPFEDPDPRALYERLAEVAGSHVTLKRGLSKMHFGRLFGMTQGTGAYWLRVEKPKLSAISKKLLLVVAIMILEIGPHKTFLEMKRVLEAEYEADGGSGKLEDLLSLGWGNENTAEAAEGGGGLTSCATSQVV